MLELVIQGVMERYNRMVKQVVISLTLVVITGSCKAQNAGCNSVKRGKVVERTTEKFNARRYYAKR